MVEFIPPVSHVGPPPPPQGHPNPSATDALAIQMKASLTPAHQEMDKYVKEAQDQMDKASRDRQDATRNKPERG